MYVYILDYIFSMKMQKKKKKLNVTMGKKNIARHKL